MEPDWVEHSACLVGCFQAVTIGSQLYSAVNGQTSVASLTQPDMSYYAEQRGLQLIDWEMHKDIANLFLRGMAAGTVRDNVVMGNIPVAVR